MRLQAPFRASQTEALAPGSRGAALALQTGGTGGQGRLSWSRVALGGSVVPPSRSGCMERTEARAVPAGCCALPPVLGGRNASLAGQVLCLGSE